MTPLRSLTILKPHDALRTRATLYGRRASLALSFSAAAFTARMFIGTSSRIRHSSCGAAGAVGQ